MKPDRVVVGVREVETGELLHELYKPILADESSVPGDVARKLRDDQVCGHCMLATKISFINEMANLCERLGADVNAVRNGIGHDSRIGFQFLHSWRRLWRFVLPKDIRAMISLAKTVGMETQILTTVDMVNEKTKARHVRQDQATGGRRQAHGQNDCSLGLAFKPRTDDIREASALVLIKQLLAADARFGFMILKQCRTSRRSLATRSLTANAFIKRLMVPTYWQSYGMARNSAIRTSP